LSGAGDHPARAAEEFRRFADDECRGYCRFYEELSRAVAADPEVAALTRTARAGQRLPNLLFGAVRLLLLRGADTPLRRHYERAAAEGAAAAGDPAWPGFRGFCLERAGEIEGIVGTRLVQTNEVGRCATLLPALSRLAAEGRGRPLGLVELGCSAGLLLYPDRLRYRYAAASGGVVERGSPGAPLALDCELRGDPSVLLPAAEVRVASRLGIDLHPVDLRDEEEALWLRALVWPDRPDREARLAAAAGLLRAEPPDLRRGDAATLLPAALAEAPGEALAVVFHSAAWHQFPGETRRGVERALADASARRPVGRVGIESARGSDADLEVSLWSGGRPRLLQRARAHFHGTWLDGSAGGGSD
jgi:hypothetical protein